MNDALSGQLTSVWTIPPYAREHLWVEGEGGSTQCEGAKGLFTLDTPSEMLTVRWGSPDGAALATLRWRVDSLAWEGTVKIGGYVDALHVAEIDALPEPVVILHIGGRPLRPEIQAYPGMSARGTPITLPDYEAGIADAVDETVTTWVALEGSAPLTLAQDALVTKLRVYSFGRLAEAAEGWHSMFALPIALEGMTIFAP